MALTVLAGLLPGKINVVQYIDLKVNVVDVTVSKNIRAVYLTLTPKL